MKRIGKKVALLLAVAAMMGGYTYAEQTVEELQKNAWEKIVNNKAGELTAGERESILKTVAKFGLIDSIDRYVKLNSTYGQVIGDNNHAVDSNSIQGRAVYGGNHQYTKDAAATLGHQGNNFGTNSVVVGYQPSAFGENSIAMGTGATTFPIKYGENFAGYANAIGADAWSGDMGNAFGAGAVAMGQGSVAIGTRAVAGSPDIQKYIRKYEYQPYFEQLQAAYPNIFGETQPNESGTERSERMGKQIFDEYSSYFRKIGIPDFATFKTRVSQWESVLQKLGWHMALSKDARHHVTALGFGATATATGGVALGAFSEADRGTLNMVKDPYSGAELNDKNTMGAISVGNAEKKRQIINVAAGTEDTDAVNVAQLKALNKKVDGKKDIHFFSSNGLDSDINYDNQGARAGFTTAIGPDAMATEENSQAFGFRARAIGHSSIVFGVESTASGARDIAIGYGSHAVGSDNTNTSWNDTIAIGWNALSRGGSFASGSGAVAGGSGSVALGFGAYVGTKWLDDETQKAQNVNKWVLTRSFLDKGLRDELKAKFPEKFAEWERRAKNMPAAIGSEYLEQKLYTLAMEQLPQMTSPSMKNNMKDMDSSIAIGHGARVYSASAIAIGSKAKVGENLDDAIALGNQSLATRNAGGFGYDPTSDATTWEAFKKVHPEVGVGAVREQEITTELNNIKVEMNKMGNEYAAWIDKEQHYDNYKEERKAYAEANGRTLDSNNEWVDWILHVRNEQQKLKNKGQELYDKFSALQKELNSGKGAWVGGKAALAIGNEEAGVTRQITGVAAGTKDTDAVNVAQLKVLNTKVDKVAANSGVHYFSVNSSETGEGSNYKNDGAVGENSIAIGNKAEAFHWGSSAVGNQAWSIGAFSQAWGWGAIASGEPGIDKETYDKLSEAEKKNYQLYSFLLDTGDKSLYYRTKYEEYTPEEYRALLADRQKALDKIGYQYSEARKKEIMAPRSLAIGIYARAIGKYTTAVGNWANAAGIQATALGTQAKATGDFSIAAGDRAEASGGQSVAVGTHAKSDGAFSTAVGVQAKSSGQLSIAVGFKAVTNFTESIAVGNKAETVKGWSAAIGSGAKTEGEASTAVGGLNASATVDYGAAFGSYSVAQRASGVAGYLANGQKTKAWKSNLGAFSVGDDVTGYSRQITGVAAGSEDTDAVNVAQLKVLNTKVDKVAANSTAYTVETKENNDNTTTVTIKSNKAGDTGTTVTVATKDIHITSGTYDKNTKKLTFTTNTNTTFDVDMNDVLNAAAEGSVHYLSVKSSETGEGSNYKNDGAKAKDSIVLGVRSLSEGINGVVVGNDNTLTGIKNNQNNSVVMGYGLNVDGVHNIVVGTNYENYDQKETKVKGEQNTVIGNGNLVGYRAAKDPNDDTKWTYTEVSTSGSDLNVVVGSCNTANGSSVAVGSSLEVENLGRAFGSGNKIIGSDHGGGQWGLALGSNNTVKGEMAVSVGTGTNASGDYTVSIGSEAKTNAKKSIAMGYQAETVKGWSAAIGSGAKTEGTASTAVGGFKASATVDYGAAFGSYSVAQRASGVAGYLANGQKTKAWKSNLGAFSVGDDVTGYSRQITGVAAGSEDTDAVNVAQLKVLATLPMNMYFGGKVENNTYTPGKENWSMPLNEFRMDFGDGLKATQVEKDGKKYTLVTLDKESLKGDPAFKGDKGETGATGKDGTNGKSAYQLWTEQQNPDGSKPNENKSEQDFINSLKGEKGKDGTNGTNGTNGKSAYEIWKSKSGNENKTEDEFLASLKGKDGQDGKNGVAVDVTVKASEKGNDINEAKFVINIKKPEMTFVGDRNIKTSIEKDNTVKIALKDTITAKTIKVGEKVKINDDGAIFGDVKIDRKKGTITGLTNKTWDPNNIESGRAATEDQLQQATQNMQNHIYEIGKHMNGIAASNAALAGLHPLEYDEDDKWNLSAAIGNYKGANAFALGAFYQPNERTMLSIGGTLAGEEHLLNVGLSLKTGPGTAGKVYVSRAAMAREIKVLKEKGARRDEQINQQKAEIKALKEKEAQRDEQIRKLTEMIVKLQRRA